jgi:hypothetical protein
MNSGRRERKRIQVVRNARKMNRIAAVDERPSSWERESDDLSAPSTVVVMIGIY